MKRIFWVIIWIFAEILSVSIGVVAYAGPAANSLLIPSEFDRRYGVGKAGCSSNCHGLTRDSKFKDGTAYGLALQGAMGFPPNDTSLTKPQLLRFDNVEAEFAPHVSSIEGLTEPGGSITLSGATDTISVSFDVGKNFFGSQAGVSLSSLGLGGDLGSYVSNVTASSVELSILEISKTDRGDRRRINSPYTLNFNPINSQGFKNFAAENQKRNRFDITFSNIAPVGEPDNVIPSAQNTATNKLNIDVLANDRDDDGPQDQLKVALISGLTGSNTGTLEIDSSGNAFLYSVPEQLPANSTTETQFTYAPVDGENLQGDPVTVTIQIPKGLNPPVAEDDMFTLDEDTTLSENVFGNDSDPEGLDTVSFSIVNVPDKGAFSFNSDGTFSYTPEENQTASVFFDYSASDGNASDQARVVLRITAQNDAPVAIGDSFVSSSSNTSSNKLSLPVLGNDSDVDHDRSGLSVVLVSDLTGTSPGMLELNSDSTGFLYTVPNPLPDSQQQTTFAYAPVDGAGAQGNTVSVSITIPSPSATPPVARDDEFTFAEDTTLSENVSVDNGNGADSDPDGLGTVTYSILSDPLRGVLDLQSDGAFTYTPAENDEGDLSFQYNMDDGTTSVSGTVTLMITRVNDAPVGSEDTYDAQVENTDENKLEMRVLANDMDADHSSEDLSVVIVSDLADASEGSLEIGPDGDAILYAVPDPLPDTPTLVSFTYAPRDAEGLEGDPVTGTVSIPAKPVVSSVVAQNDAFSFEEDDVFSGDVKVDNGSGPDTSASGLDLLEFSVLNAPKEETGQLEMASNGTFTFTPTLDYTGSAQFDYVASDGTSSNTAKVVLTITPVNDAPVANATVLPRREESEADFTVDLLDPAYVADADGDTLKVDNVVVLVSFIETDNVPLKFTETDLYSESSGLITFKPTAAIDLDEDESATITLTYQILDGISEPVENTITQQIFGIDNGLGRLAGEYATSISERYNGHFGGINEANGSCHTCHVPGQVNADVDTVDECVQSPSVFNEYGLKLCLNRDAGTPALADLLRRMQEAEPEFAPRLSPSSGLLIDETATSGDPIGEPLEALSKGKTVDGGIAEIVDYLIVANGTPAQVDATGQFTVDDTGQIRVADGANLTPGQHSFVVLPINDAGQKDNTGAVLKGRPGFFPVENTTSFTVTVAAISPVAAADAISTLENTPVTIDLTGNDTAGNATSISISTNPTNGTAVVNGDLSVTYSPATDFIGTDTFAYTAINESGSSNPATVTITVLENGNVIARDDQVTALAGATARIDVLANDDGVTTSGLDMTVVQIVSAPDALTVGSAAIDGQVITFTALDDFVGETSLTYSATNSGSTATTNARVVITVLDSGGTTISDRVENPELKQVARSLEQSCALSTNAEFLHACSDITAAAVNSEDLEEIMKALRNEEHFAAVDTAHSVARSFGRSLSRRIRTMRAGGPGGFDFDGLNVSVNNQALPSQLLDAVTNGALGFGHADPDSPVNWNLFFSGDISVSEKDASGIAKGFETRAANMMIGLEYSLDENSDIGFALGYTKSNTDYSGGGGLNSDAVQASIYGRLDDAIGEGINFDGYLTFGRMSFESDRRILFTANGANVDSVASAKFNGSYINISPSLSFSEQLGRYGDPLGAPLTDVNLQWSLGLDYLLLQVDDYTETGGSGLALTTQSESYDSLQLFAGINASRPIWLTSEFRTELRGGLMVYGEMLDQSRSVTSSFAAAGAGAPSFTVTEGGNSGLGGTLELGLTIDLIPNVFDLDYAYDHSASGVRTHSLAFEYQRRFGRSATFAAGIRQDFSGSGANDIAASAEYRLRF